MLPPQPYCGLRPFREEEADIFFGRAAEVEEITSRLCDRRVTVLLGSSGSGKSSLVNAGLFPTLRSGLHDPEGRPWTILRMRPGRDPLAELGRVYAASGLSPTDDPTADLYASQRALAEGLETGSGPVLLVVDQFEEVFRFRDMLRGGGGWQDDVELFVSQLLEATRIAGRKVRLLLVMRSEFVAHCAEIPTLAEVLGDAIYILPPLCQDAVREVVEEPLRAFDASAEPGLTLAFQRAVGESGASLPVVEHALLRVWGSACARAEAPVVLRVTDLAAVSDGQGIFGVLDVHGSELWQRAIDAGDNTRERALLIERIFRRLCFTNANGVRVRNPVVVEEALRDLGMIRVPADLGEAVSRLEGLLRPFLDAEFLNDTPAEQPFGFRTTVDLSHESLLRHWRRLDHWLNQEAADTNFYRRLLEHARDERDGKADLLTGTMVVRAVDFVARLEPVERWAQRLPDGGLEADVALVRGLVRRSKAVVDAAAAAVEAGRARAAREAEARREAAARAAIANRQERERSYRNWFFVWLAVCGVVAGAAVMMSVGWAAQRAASARVTASADAATAVQTARIEALQSENDQLAKLVGEKDEEVRRLGVAVEEATTEKSTADRAYDALLQEQKEALAKGERVSNDLLASLEAARRQQEAAALRLQEATDAKTSLEQEVRAMTDRSGTLAVQLESARATAQTLEGEVTALEGQLRDLTGANQQLMTLKDDLAQRLEAEQVESARLRGELATCGVRAAPQGPPPPTEPEPTPQAP